MKNILLGICVLFAMASFAQKNDCANFKNGKFKILDPKMGTIIIERRGNTQIEYIERDEVKLKFKVTWIDECSFTLERTRIMKNPHHYEFPDDYILTMEIISTNGNSSYVERFSSNKFEKVTTQTLTRIE